MVFTVGGCENNQHSVKSSYKGFLSLPPTSGSLLKSILNSQAIKQSSVDTQM